MTTIEWNNVKTLDNKKYFGVTYSKKDNLFYSIGTNTNTNTIFIENSFDGINWTEVYRRTYKISFNTDIFGQIFYIEERELYIAFLPNQKEPINDTDCVTSSDGITWTFQSTIKNYITTFGDQEILIYNRNLIYDKRRNIFMCTLNSPNRELDNNRLFRSSNGKNWTIVNSIDSVLAPNAKIVSMVYITDTILLTVTYPNTSSDVVISKDGGNTWSINLKTDKLLTQIVSSDKIITVFSSGSETSSASIFTSKLNKLSWRETPISKLNNCIVYQTLYTNGLFTIVGFISNSTIYGTSVDGINWIVNPLVNNYTFGLSYSNYLNRYITFRESDILLGVPQIEPICLPSGSPILTDQGTFPIEKLDISAHTIDGKRIIAVTQTITPEKSLICFEKDSLSINCPNKRTIMTPGHEVLYKGKLVQAKHFVGRLDGVHTVAYDGKVLYNVLHEVHGLMNVNNMILETLNPKNRIAKSILLNIK